MFKIFKIIGGLLIFIFVLIGILSSFKGSVSPDLLIKQTDSYSYLKNNKEAYAKCYNSINYPTTNIKVISLKYYVGATEEFKQKVKDTENSLINSVNEKCIKPVNDYENTYTTLINTTKDINNKNRSLFDKLVGLKPEDAEQIYNDVQPQYARLSQGFNTGYYTEEEIQSYFKEKLGF
ncbi:MAG: hypothetical protein KC414_05465 [Romboutsia sp.]|nr:hypothetical protein [Romboutsia sp.]